MDKKITTWEQFFVSIKNEPYARTIHQFLDDEYRSYVCYPSREKILNAFSLTPLDKVKVVIVGQDPYHEPDQAIGLAFAVPNGVKIPPSLNNILKEIEGEYETEFPYSGDLTYLAKQGVLLINAILSVRKGEPLSHDIPEYKKFLSDVISLLETKNQPIVYLLWGGNARKLKSYIHNPNHLVLESVHPSPLAANRGGWFGNGHFKKTNEFLVKHKVASIDWVRDSKL